ncbi:MAG: thioredoxin family protein [Acidimicrobiales bacterium]
MIQIGQEPAVVLVTTPHCPHCRTVKAHIEGIASSVKGVAYREVSAPEEPDLATEFKIKAAPTLLAFRDGEEVTRHVGAASAAEVERVFHAASGAITKPRSFSISAENRWFRSATGVALLVAGAALGVLWLVLLGAVFMTSGWYDRFFR